MAIYEFKLPDIGEGIAEAEIVAWHAAVGVYVEEDAPLADLMTDKATVEMTAPVAGKLVGVAGEVGDQIAIGSIFATFETADEQSVAEEVMPERNEVAGPKLFAATEPEPAPPPEPAGAESLIPPKGEVPTPALAGTGAKVRASPAVRQRARDLEIDLSEVRPAEDGRVRHSDLDAFLAYNSSGGFQPAGRKGQDEQVRVIGLRRRIAENMAASKRNIPHFTYVEEYDVTALEEMRAQLNEGRALRQTQDEWPKLTMLPFLITAICKLIPKYPMLNAHYDDEAGVVTRSGSVHLGMAAQTPAGLMVPVIRDAQGRNLWQLAAEITRLANAARDGSAKAAELSGSTITVTSLGPIGGMATTPIINRPEVAIIGPNRIVERPMFMRDSNGAERVVKRKLMNISMSCDHRVVDGWDAASFAQDLKKLIEAPAMLLAEHRR